MRFVEYGKENSQSIILLHGGGLGWWSCRAAAKALAMDFHVVIPTLDGHSGADRSFMSIGENARELIDYIDREHSGKVAFIGGLSLGGQILCEMLSLRSDICEVALIESASVVPCPRWISAIVRPTMDMCYPLISQKWFAKWQFKYLRIREDLFPEYFEDTVKIAKNDMTSFLEASIEYELKPSVGDTQARVIVLIGGKEQRGVIQSAEAIHKAITKSELIIKEGFYHGEWSINHPNDYADMVKELLR